VRLTGAPYPGGRRALELPRGLRTAQAADDRRLTAGLSETDLDAVRTGLGALETNVRPG